MKRLIAVLGLLLAAAPALAGVGVGARVGLADRTGPQLSPTWSFPTACLVHISAANVATAYVPASDTDASRGLQLIDATTAATDGTIYQGRNTCDIDTGVVLAHGVNYEGLGTGKSIITSDANVEIFYVYGTCIVRNLKVMATGDALDCFLVQGNGTAGATSQGNLTLEYCETNSNGNASPKPGVWLNAGSPANTTNNGTATIRYCLIDGGVTTHNAFTAERSTFNNHAGRALATIVCNVNGAFTLSNCTLSHDGTSNLSIATATPSGSGTFSSTSDTYTLAGGTGNCVNMAGLTGTKTANFYSCTFTAPAAGFGVRVGGASVTAKVWNGSITGPDGVSGFSLIRTAGTLSYNSETQNGYAATTGSPSLSTSGTVGTSN